MKPHFEINNHKLIIYITINIIYNIYIIYALIRNNTNNIFYSLKTRAKYFKHVFRSQYLIWP